MDRIDEAAASILAAYTAKQIASGGHEVWPPELAAQMRVDDMRAALLASLPVLLGPRVGWMVGDLFFDPDAEADARHEAQWSESKVMAIYAPSLGEGDGR